MLFHHFFKMRLVTFAGVFRIAKALAEDVEEVLEDDAGRRHVYLWEAGRLSNPLATAAGSWLSSGKGTHMALISLASQVIVPLQCIARCNRRGSAGTSC